ncbi:MAG: NADH-quinone oxidoreductase subunit C [Clostridia bacterium]|nr:NADH-quinone oxidoreductase subunit C [Clostridia bacterium]
MQEYKIIEINREQIIPVAGMMRGRGVPLAMIHGHIEDDGQPVIAYEYAIGSLVESYQVKGERSLPTISTVYDAGAEWPEREIMELMDVTFEGLDASKRLFMPENMISGQGHIIVTPMDKLIDQARGKEE